MRAGKLRHRVTLQSPTGSRDAVGERVTTWTNVAEDVPAEIEPISGREQFLAAQRQATTSHIVRLRYASMWAAMDASWRVLFGSRVFTIDAPPKNVGESDVELILQCTEGERQE
jgi:SPP1 family predicted phage head-tail adaptor